MAEKSTRMDQPHAWIVFEKKSGLFAGFFFDEDLARKYQSRSPDTLHVECWVSIAANTDATFRAWNKTGKAPHA